MTDYPQDFAQDRADDFTYRERLNAALARESHTFRPRDISDDNSAWRGRRDALRYAVQQSPFTRRALAAALPANEIGGRS